MTELPSYRLLWLPAVSTLCPVKRWNLDFRTCNISSVYHAFHTGRHFLSATEYSPARTLQRTIDKGPINPGIIFLNNAVTRFLPKLVHCSNLMLRWSFQIIRLRWGMCLNREYHHYYFEYGEGPSRWGIIIKSSVQFWTIEETNTIAIDEKYIYHNGGNLHVYLTLEW